MHRIFSLGDAVAVAAGMIYRREGASDDRVVGVVRFLSGLGIDRLKEELTAGRTIPAPGAMFGVDYLPGLMVEQKDFSPMSIMAEALMKRIDKLPSLVETVERKVEQIIRRPTKGKKKLQTVK